MPAGDKKMKEIAGAIQEGASAYLKRQYITISFVGIIIFYIHFNFLRLEYCSRLFSRSFSFRSNRFIGMHISVELMLEPLKQLKKV